MRHTAIYSTLALCLALTPLAALAHDDPVGTPPEKLGSVAFANSCAQSAQATFERGVALLHSFWWEEGRKTFRAALAQDPGCAIATWGIAAIDIGNPFAAGPTPAQAGEARDAIAKGRAIGAKTERERGYIDAIAAYYDSYPDKPHGARLKALSAAFERLAARFPDDDETQIFAALYLVSTQAPTDKTYAPTLRAAAVLEKQFAKHPDHPGVAHYLIHAYDYPALADKGVAAALCYALIAPSAPHALHMPSHIFTLTGDWRKSVTANLRSAAAATAEGDPTDRLHASDYLVYADLQLARDRDADNAIETAKRITRLPPGRAPYYALAAMPARYVVERGAWSEAKNLQPAPNPFPYTVAMTYFARALGEARSGDPAAAEPDVRELARIVAALRAAKDEYWATEVEVQRLGAEAWTAFARGDRNGALGLMRQAADMEDASDKSAVTPGRLMPARELLGDMLLESGQAANALMAYEASLTLDPKRFRTLYGAGLAAAQSGDREKARLYYGRLVAMVGDAASRPELAKARAYLAAK
jgi:tetratricopeptide (TPR) repeat protein